MSALEHQDGLANCLTSLGIDDGEDTLDTRQRTYRTYNNLHYHTVDEFEAEWEQSWMANIEVSALPAAMFRGGFELTNVEPDDIDMAAVRSYIDTDIEVEADGSINQDRGINAAAWEFRESGDKVGGSALLAIVDDGLDPREPLDVRRIQRLRGWEVFDRSEITPYYTQGYGLEPEFYFLSDVLSSPDRPLKAGDVIHASRLRIHHGRKLSRRQMRYRQGWGASVLELNERERRGVEEASEYLRTYADRASWLWLSLAELDELLQRDDGDAHLVKRMKTIRKYARTLGIVVTDGGRGRIDEEGADIPDRKPDQLSSVQESTGDLTKIAEWDLKQWARGTGLPASFALNEQPGGLAGGDNKGDQQKMQGLVTTHQKWATRVVDWMLTILFCSREGPTGGKLPTWKTVWPPLYVPTPMESAELDRERAEADAVRIRSNTIEPGEVTQQRFVDGDQHGPLRVTREEVDGGVDAGIGPALVGIATQVLAGAVAVGEGVLPPEFYALYLNSIDEQRYPPDRALEAAQSIAADPLPPAKGEATEDAAAGEPPVDPLASLFADIEPGELRTPKAIAEELTERSGLTIHTRAITDLIKRHNIQPRRVGNKTGFSLREVATVLGADGQPPPESDPVRADAARRSPMIVGLMILSDLAEAVVDAKRR